MSILNEMLRHITALRQRGIEPRLLRLDHEEYWRLTRAFKACEMFGSPDSHGPLRDVFFQGIRIIEDEPV